MAVLSVSTTVACPPQRVEEVLHQHDFLAAFVAMQHPTQCQLVANEPPHQSSATWAVDLPDDLPRFARTLVGNAISLELWIQTSPQGRLRLNASGNVKGSFDAELSIHPSDHGTAIDIAGDVAVSVAVGGGLAAKMARDEVIRPVLVEDLFPLLDDWCARL